MKKAIRLMEEIKKRIDINLELTTKLDILRELEESNLISDESIEEARIELEEALDENEAVLMELLIQTYDE